MKKWIITALVVAALATLALTSQRWLPPLLSFVGTNTDVIQGLSDLVQLLLWTGAALALVVGLWRRKKDEPKPTSEAQTTSIDIAGNQNAPVGRDVRDSNIVTGEDHIVGERVEIGGDVVKGHKTTNIYAAPAPTASALHQLPPPPRDFTGRKEELKELMAALAHGGVTISGLQGLGGVGKTTLALKLAEQLAPRYPDAQFYLDLKGTSPRPLSVADAQAHIIHAYRPTAKLPDNEAELSALYQSVLHNQHALLLMDNAADGEQVAPLIPPSTCVLLVTSRQHFTLPGFHPKHLDALTPEDARKLLLTIAPRIAEHADTIAKLCGNLPLALRLAASALAERIDLSPTNYVARLTNAQQRLKLLDKVEASLSFSYELLAPPMQKLWRTLAVFPDSFITPSAADIWEIELDPAQDTLSELVRYSLLDWSAATARYRLHDLARLFARSRLSADELREAQWRHAAHYLEVIQLTNNLYLTGGDAVMQALALFDAEWTNIQAGFSWAERNAAEDNRALALCDDYLAWGYNILPLRQHPRERIAWLQIALKAAIGLKRRQAESWHLGNLGIAYVKLGETQQAIEFYEQRLTIAREIGDRLGEGSTLGNLGIAYADLGETQRAIKFYEQALLIEREIGDRRGEGVNLVNLGIAYADLGETRRAIELYKQQLVVVREIGDRLYEGYALGCLANAYADLGEICRAIEFYEQQLVITREIGDRRGEGIALWNMSLALDRLGSRAEAIAHGEVALKIFEEIEHPSAGKVREQLAEWRGKA
ncbi:MAG TPA: tetratricopeptide repeat protein [Pyrinomonadaceae bacterium]|jgi:tetratricopeptide (TPR) repeat protein